VSAAPARVGVVGHVEWMEFAVVPRWPAAGEIVHASQWFQEAGGGGAVAVVQMRKLAGHASFFTVLGDDAVGERTRAELVDRHAIELHAVGRPTAHRRGFCHLDASTERTITVLGERIVPHGDDPLAWERVAQLEGVYFTGGDAGALRAARAARVLVATPRALETIATAGVQLDVLVGSATDPGEELDAALDPPPRYVVATAGAQGGTWTAADGRNGAWVATPLPGPPVDAYGSGDSFAAGLTYGLAAGMSLDDALVLGARCGAQCLTGRGPYGSQLTLA